MSHPGRKTEKGKEMSRKEGLSRTQVGIYKEKDGGGAERGRERERAGSSFLLPLRVYSLTHVRTHIH